MSAYIHKDSLSKPRFRADICRPVDALSLFQVNEWDSLVILGEAGLEAARVGIADLDQYNIKFNREQMYRMQDCAVIKREGADPFSIALYVAAAVSVAASIYAYVAAKNIDVPSNVNRAQESANNRIQARENEARLGQRVEYICGQVRSYPAKMAPEYIVIEDNQQVEYGYYSAGEGLIELSDARDGRTLGELMAGWDLSAYGPNQSPLTGDAPIYQIGDYINEPIKTAFQSDEAVRNEIDPPNDLEFELDIRLTGNNNGTMTIDIIDVPADYSFIDFYAPNDFISFSGAWATAINGTVGLYTVGYPVDSGTGQSYPDFTAVIKNLRDFVNISTGLVDALTAEYEVVTVTNDQMVVNLATNLNQTQIDAINRMTSEPLIRDDIYLGQGVTGFFYSTEIADVDYYDYDGILDRYEKIKITNTPVAGVILNSDVAILGPFAGQVGIKKVQYNLLADKLLKDAGNNNLSPVTVDGTCTIRELDAGGLPTGLTKVEPWSLSSNPNNYRKQAGGTFEVTHTFERYTVEFQRTTPRDFGFNGSVSDVVELTELYFMRDEPAGAEYGNKTTIQTRRKQSTFGIGRSQKINMLAEQVYPDGKSRYFDDVLYYMALNGKFGRRTQAQADKMRTHLNEVRQEIVAYFGNEEAAYFDFTFDSTDITFESAVNQVAKAVFANAYQIGSDIKFFPDLLQDNDSMIFSHSSKQLGRQTMKYSFTDLQSKGYDCVEVKWRNPANQDAQESIFIPSQGTNAKTIELVGIRNKEKAEIHAWREWYRIKYQRFSYECLVGIEATQLVPGRRIGVVNNIAGVNFDGYIKAWDGDKRIQVSQDVDVSAGGYTLVLNTPVGSTEAFAVTQGRYPYELLLDRAPTYDINVTLMENPVAFRVAKDDDLPKDSYSVQEVKLTDKGIKVIGVNYAPEQYEKDNLMSA